MARDRSRAHLQSLLQTEDLPELGPGPRSGIVPLSELNDRLDGALAGSSLAIARQPLARSLVLLWHDHLDASHRISQGIDTNDGSYVHGIMHRREPDYGNAKYWFRRVGRHACFPRLTEQAQTLAARHGQEPLVGRLIPSGSWDALAFVDLCEALADQPADDPRVRWLRELQKAEFDLLLGSFCD